MNYTHPLDVIADAPESEPDLCGDCGAETSGTSICAGCADVRFGNAVDDDGSFELECEEPILVEPEVEEWPEPRS